MQTDDDIVLKEAVEENIALIAKKEAELAELRGKEVDTEIALDQDIDGVYL